MKKQLQLLMFVFTLGATLFLSSCGEDDVRGPFPVSADIFHSVAGKQVAFSALTLSADSWSWDFGDGETSTEKNPVHVYADGGYYNVVLTATDCKGETAVKEIEVAVALTPYILLTGGPTNTNGKTWKLSPSHPSTDRFANADADFTVADGVPPTLPSGVFSLLGIGEVYEDEYTFHYDGSYSHDTKADNAAFSGLVYQFVTTSGSGIVNDAAKAYGLCTGKYTPESGASFTYTEKENFTVPSVYGEGGKITYKNVGTLDFSGTEFVGFADFQRKVIVREIKDNTMQLVMFMAASPDYAPLNTHALILTFEAVK